MKKFLGWLKDNFTSPLPLLFLIFGFLLILLGVIVSINIPYLNLTLTPNDDYRGGAIFIGIIFIMFATIFQIRFQNKLPEKSFKSKPVTQKRILSTLSFLYEGIDLLNEVEAKSKGKDIWVISPHLKNDTGQKEVKITTNIVLRNATTRIITYTFIVPKTAEVSRATKQLQAEFIDQTDRLRIIEIDAKQFRNLALVEWVIYNPLMADGKFPDVFMQLPIDELAWWTKVSDDVASVFLERVTRIMKENGYL